MRSPTLALVLVLLARFQGPALAQARLERLASGFESPTYVTAAPGDATRLYVTERAGDIWILDPTTGQPRPAPFLDLDTPTGEGLQGLAFHPDYAANGQFFVHTSSPTDTRLVRYTRSANPDLADPASALTILVDTDTNGIHQGGWIGFGPDGYLYVPLGDGGPQNDGNDHGQSLVGDLRGTILRIDVDGDDFPLDGERNYAIPEANPFVGAQGEDEIWAYGLRNPFRCSFDRLTGDLYIADVGQIAREEIDFQAAASGGGENYGWRLREGTIATPTAGIGGPPPPGAVEPIYDYSHGFSPNEGFAVVGGYVYRGPNRRLRGQYFFADFINDRVWSLQHDGSGITVFRDWTDALQPGTGPLDRIVSFGEDGSGELYLVTLDGDVYRFAALERVPLHRSWTGLSIVLFLFGSFLRLRRRVSAPAAAQPS